jgi:hypothetical protein
VSFFEIPYKDFASFKAGEVEVSLVSAKSRTSSLASRNSQYSSPQTLKFNGTMHIQSSVDLDQISFDKDLPWQIPVGSNLQLNGTTINALRNKLVVQNPTKTFSTYDLT